MSPSIQTKTKCRSANYPSVNADRQPDLQSTDCPSSVTYNYHVLQSTVHALRILENLVVNDKWAVCIYHSQWYINTINYKSHLHILNMLLYTALFLSHTVSTASKSSFRFSILPKDSSIQTGGAGHQTTDLPVSGQPCLPPEPQSADALWSIWII